MSVEVKLIFFAKARELVGQTQTTLQVDSTISYKDLHKTIIDKFQLTDIEKTVILSLNEEYCSANEILHLKKGDEIAVIPPLSGGPTCGAISIFVGTTRDKFDGKTILNLQYECYESMAMKSLKELCVEIRKQWPDVHAIAIHHRLGTVPLKEASVIIAISSPHRATAMTAVVWCIENLKKTVPIWKKEVFSDNTEEWKENKECAWSEYNTK
ncbi:hypothetical protein FQR65_LT07628 [Abscondita terminalis]|nr:hypothetical protein FQR65_LT07628 [Abscondita terminalis]